MFERSGAGALFWESDTPMQRIANSAEMVAVRGTDRRTVSVFFVCRRFAALWGGKNLMSLGVYRKLLV
jgi:hypothetical protein